MENQRQTNYLRDGNGDGMSMDSILVFSMKRHVIKVSFFIKYSKDKSKNPLACTIYLTKEKGVTRSEIGLDQVRRMISNDNPL